MNDKAKRWHVYCREYIQFIDFCDINIYLGLKRIIGLSLSRPLCILKCRTTVSNVVFFLIFEKFINLLFVNRSGDFD